MHRIAALIHAGEIDTAAAELRFLHERHGTYQRIADVERVCRKTVMSWASKARLTGKLGIPGRPQKGTQKVTLVPKTVTGS